LAPEAETEADHLPEVDETLLPLEVDLPLKDLEVLTDGLLPERKEWIMAIDETILIEKEIVSEIEETNFEVVMIVEWIITEIIEMIGEKGETIFVVVMTGEILEDEMAEVTTTIEIGALVEVITIIEEVDLMIEEVVGMVVEDMAKPIDLNSLY